MTVLKPQRPLQPLKPTDPTKPKHLTKKPRLVDSVSRSRLAEEVPEFGTGTYVAALKKQDDPHGSRSTLTSATSSLSAMRSGEWLNPTYPIPNYLAHDSGLAG